MKKYRIITAYKGFFIQKKFLFWWTSTMFDTKNNNPWKYESLEEAKEDLEELKKVGKVIK